MVTNDMNRVDFSVLFSVYKKETPNFLRSAIDSVFNQTWTKIDLSSIGYCYALEFSMTSTDTGQWGMNTPSYFALDALTVSTDSPTTSLRQTNAEQPKATKRLINGQLYIEQNNRLYTLTGVAL